MTVDEKLAQVRLTLAKFRASPALREAMTVPERTLLSDTVNMLGDGPTGRRATDIAPKHDRRAAPVLGEPATPFPRLDSPIMKVMEAANEATERAAFEAAALRAQFFMNDLRRHSADQTMGHLPKAGDYIITTAQAGWLMWQAGRAQK